MHCSWRFHASLHSPDDPCLAAQGRKGVGSFTTQACSFHPQALNRLTFATEQRAFHSQLLDYVGPEMSMNALLPRTLTSQVCGRVQLQCLRPLRVQGLTSSSLFLFSLIMHLALCIIFLAANLDSATVMQRPH